jgi:hypothetical protein
MTDREPVSRTTVLTMLAGFGDRQPYDVGERIDSLELAWLVHEVSRRYGVRLDEDQALDRMTTVTAAVEVIQQAMHDDPVG